MPASTAEVAPVSPRAKVDSFTPPLVAVTPELRFELAVLFFRDERKRTEISYDHNVKLVALYRQATQGKYDSGRVAQPGFFDFAGKHRTAAWAALGDLTRADAMVQFFDRLSEYTESFSDWYTQRIREKEEQARQRRDALEKERREREKIELERQERIRQKELERARLERQRLEQERMSQLRGQQQQQQQQQQAVVSPGGVASGGKHVVKAMGRNARDEDSQTEVPPPTKPAEEVQKEIEAFCKAHQGDAGKELDVARGEVVTVKVLNKIVGRCRIDWEFHTPNYDIAFGLDYEPEVEGGPVVALLPTMRTRSNAEVIKGSHIADKPGCWLMRFDNAFSMLRSKKVIHHVSCTKLP